MPPSPPSAAPLSALSSIEIAAPTSPSAAAPTSPTAAASAADVSSDEGFADACAIVASKRLEAHEGKLRENKLS
eukprot:6182457-Pleurochrysis_carterae.AAC.1